MFERRKKWPIADYTFRLQVMRIYPLYMISRLQTTETTNHLFSFWVCKYVCMHICMYVYVHTSLLKYAVIYGHFIQNVTDFTIKMCPHMMICNYILGFQISIRFRMTISSLNFQYLSFEIAPIPKKQEKWPPKAVSVNKYLSLCLIGNKVQWYASSSRNSFKLNMNFQYLSFRIAPIPKELK